MEHRDQYEALLRRAEEAFAEEDYAAAEEGFAQADRLMPEEAAAAFYGAVAGALRDGADYRKMEALTQPAERYLARAAEQSGSGAAYFAVCRRALSAVLDVTSRHYEAVAGYVKKERKKNRRHPEAAEQAEALFRDCVSLIGETARRTAGAALEHADDVTAADEFFWDCALTLLDNAEACRAAAGLGKDAEIAALFGEIDRLRGNIFGEFAGEPELIEPGAEEDAYTETVCPSCGERLSFPAGIAEAECPFCGNALR